MNSQAAAPRPFKRAAGIVGLAVLVFVLVVLEILVLTGVAIPPSVRVGVSLLAVVTAVVLVIRLQRRLIDRTEAEAQVRESQSQFRMFVDGVKDYAIFMLSPTGVITSWNEGAERIMGYSSSEVIGEHFSTLHLARDRADGRSDDALSMALSAGRYEEEGWRMRRDGSRFWAHVVITPVYDRDGKHKGFIKITRDRTESRLHEDELKKAKEAAEKARAAAEEANRAKTNFLANISHEIRTPLGVILGYAELLENPHQTRSDRHHSISIIKRNGEMLSRIINDILDLSKIEADQVEIEKERLSLPALLRDLHVMFNQIAGEKGIRFDFKIDGQVPEQIYSDPTRIRQILLNVVGNAIKFTERGHVTVALSLAYAGNSNLLQFVVNDQGPGIDSPQMLRLFRPFEQADASPTRKFGGTGLGLALSRRLARALGGDLVLLRSDAVNGSSFALTIDAGPIDGVRLIDRLDLRPQPEQLPLETSLESSRLDGMHILVVEDLPDNQLLISRFLRMAGATVDLAGNGWEALKKTAGPDDTYDLILMDIQMPEMDGYQATRKLRERGYDRPILALTAHALKEEREKSLAAGCDDHLTKPIDRELLIDRVALYHGRKHVFPPKMAGGSPAVLH